MGPIQFQSPHTETPGFVPGVFVMGYGVGMRMFVMDWGRPKNTLTEAK